jgi:hypothetical protein
MTFLIVYWGFVTHFIAPNVQVCYITVLPRTVTISKEFPSDDQIIESDINAQTSLLGLGNQSEESYLHFLLQTISPKIL